MKFEFVFKDNDCVEVYRNGAMIDECLSPSTVTEILEDIITWSIAEKIIVETRTNVIITKFIGCFNMDRTPETSDELENKLLKLLPRVSDALKINIDKDTFNRYCNVESKEYAVCIIRYQNTDVEKRIKLYVRGKSICIYVSI